MAKPQFQDIVPPDRRSIQRIPVPHRQQSGYTRQPVIQHDEEYQQTIDVEQDPPKRQIEERRRITDRVIRPVIHEEEEDIEEYPAEKQERRSRKKKGFSKTWYILPVIIVLILLGIYLAVPKLSGARVLITPEQQQVSVDSQFTASKNATSTSLTFQTVTISKDGKLSVAANGEETVNIKASGTIVIYNGFSSAPQKLVGNTRFATPAGLIFRISQSITVPGAKIVNGETIPGSIEAVVTADGAGANYNVGLTDFTIPGFKGDPKYSKIYARSKAPIQGGFSGTRKKLNDTQVLEAQDKIKTELKTSLVRQAEKDIPSDAVLPTNAYYIEYENLPNVSTGDNQVELNVRATFHGFLFKKADLAQQIAQKSNGTIASPGNISGIETLTFVMKDASNPISWTGNTITFSLRGNATIYSAVDTDKLQNELLGKPRKSLNAILAGYPGVAKAEVIMRPFWNTVFPEKKEDIAIELTLKP